MSDPIKKRVDYSWVILFLFLILTLVLAFWYFRFFRLGNDLAATRSIGEFKVINQKVISDIKELRSCGSWPMKAVNLSAQRGNPFTRKNLDVSPMAASSTPECLPVSQ